MIFVVRRLQACGKGWYSSLSTEKVAGGGENVRAWSGNEEVFFFEGWPYIFLDIYDLSNEEETTLALHPASVGNVTDALSQEEVRETLRQAKASDPEAFGRLHAWCFPSVYRYCSTRAPTREDAEDLTEEVFLEVVEGIGRLRADTVDGIFAWVIRIARNKVADYYRRKAKLREWPLAFEEEPPDQGPSPAEYAEAATEREALRAALEQLTPDQRDVVLCKFILGYGNERTAQITKKNPNAVNALQYRALASLRKLLGKEEIPNA